MAEAVLEAPEEELALGVAQEMVEEQPAELEVGRVITRYGDAGTFPSTPAVANSLLLNLL